jgi:hypothetical protein
MIPCTHCGHDNELGRIFCYQCGARLELEDVKPPKESARVWKKARRRDLAKSGKGIGRRIFALSRMVVVFGLILAIVLMFVPPAVKQIGLDDVERMKAAQKWAGLEKALEKGTASSVELTEIDVNALLPPFVAEEGTSGIMSFLVKKRHVELGDGKITSVLAGKLALGDMLQLPMTVRLTGRLIAANGEVNFEETELWVGCLPFSPVLFPAVGFLRNRVENFWSDDALKERRALAGRAKDLSVRGGIMILETGGTAPVAGR